jgi:site-specific DNA-methyltransferase (adenine-specific)
MKQVEMSDKQYEDYLIYLTLPTNIQDVKKPNKKEFGEYNTHPTIKPVKLMEWLVKLLSSEGDIVVDPFSGSGTTAVACKNLNRSFIGCEMNQEYIDIAKRRLDDTNIA